MQKTICDFCKKEISDIFHFKVVRMELDKFDLDTTGFANRDICTDCLRKLDKENENV